MEIAHGLDAAERAVMSEMGTDTSDFVKFISVSLLPFKDILKIYLILTKYPGFP
jgi:hypothetical protein